MITPIDKNSIPKGSLKMDGFDDAIIGLLGSTRIVYDYDKILQILAESMTMDEAREYYGFNIERSFAYLTGLNVPIVVRKVKYAGDCGTCIDCGEPWCDECEDHYCDCDCPGPHSHDNAYEINDEIYVDVSVSS